MANELAYVNIPTETRHVFASLCNTKRGEVNKTIAIVSDALQGACHFEVTQSFASFPAISTYRFEHNEWQKALDKYNSIPKL